jgi:hypothetical protein
MVLSNFHKTLPIKVTLAGTGDTWRHGMESMEKISTPNQFPNWKAENKSRPMDQK